MMSTIKLIRDLGNIVGSNNISDDKDVLNCAGFPDLGRPEVIIFPTNQEEICQIVAYANQNHIRIVPIGGGSNIRSVLGSPGGGLGISLRSMTRILEFEPDNLSLIVQAGLTNDLLQKAIKESDLFLPVFPDWEESTIGGEVGSNSGSRKRGRYGSINDYVLGVEFVSPQGQLVKTGGKTVKNASGYDFTKMIGGSWGIMGVITSVTLKLQPLPEKEVILIASFKNSKQAILVGKQVLAAKLFPVSLDVFAGRGLEAWTESAEAILVAGIEGSREAVEEQRQKMMAIIGANTQTLNEKASIQLFWEKYHQFRRNLQGKAAGAAAFDKRLLEDIGQALTWVMECKGAVQLDIAAGMIEFSLFDRTDQCSEAFFKRLLELGQQLGKGLKMDGNELTRQLVLEKIMPIIDPAVIMFPHNRLLRGVFRG